MSKKYKKICTNLKYIEHFLILASTVTGSISVSVFASLFGIPKGIATFVIGLKIFAITVGIKKYKYIIRGKKRSMIK